jgi:hypothetical protein
VEKKTIITSQSRLNIKKMNKISIIRPDKYPNESIDDIIASAYKSWKGEGKK